MISLQFSRKKESPGVTCSSNKDRISKVVKSEATEQGRVNNNIKIQFLVIGSTSFVSMVNQVSTYGLQPSSVGCIYNNKSKMIT